MRHSYLEAAKTMQQIRQVIIKVDKLKHVFFRNLKLLIPFTYFCFGCKNLFIHTIGNSKAMYNST